MFEHGVFDSGATELLSHHHARVEQVCGSFDPQVGHQRNGATVEIPRHRSSTGVLECGGRA
jgi:hypothetical protein